MKPDDPSVEGKETLYWRAQELPREHWTVFDEGRGDYRVRSGAFILNDDGMSCYRRTVLNSLGLDWSAVKILPKNGILSVQAADVRACELGVAPDPDPPYIPRADLQPRDKAHALIVIGDGATVKKWRRRCSSLAPRATIVHMGNA